MKMRSQYLLGASLMFALSGCSSHVSDESVSSAARPSGVLRVVAIERVYGDLAHQIGPPGIDVTTILNSPSADPHAYEPTPRDADAIAAADVVVENGLGYDAFADKLLAASPNPNRAVLIVGALAGHHAGDNPHVWYEATSLRLFSSALASELTRRLPARASTIARNQGAFASWVARFSTRLRALGQRHRGASVAITEPVFDYVLKAAHVTIATPESFSHAIEEGNDPAPQDVATMHALLATRRVAAFVYNGQTVEPSTARLLDLARAAHVPIVPVTETLPANEKTQAWIDREVTSLERAL